MEIFRTLDSVQIGPSACAIGMFDGVHLGHHMVLEQAIRASKISHLSSVVFTFANHPQSIISQTPTPLLSSLEERLEAFENLGFEATLLLDFTPELKAKSAEDFVQTILLDTLQVKAVSIGYDHRFGKGRQGDGTFLKSQGEMFGFQVDIIEPVKVDHQIVSSTLIRKLLSYGDLDGASQLLGHPYKITGIVEEGKGRGRVMGFPTANLHVSEDRLVPAQGVYAGIAQVEGKDPQRPAICNIGVAPTFADQSHVRIEVHLLDYNANLYGKILSFTFLHHLRKEQTFPSVNELTAQLHQDYQQAKSLLSENPLPT